jgi:PTS system nitrogen regulatory IIA component
MDLTLKEVASILKLPPRAVVKMVKERKMRAYRIYSQYRFNRDELNEWILKGKIKVSADVVSLVQSSVPVNMYKVFRQGGVFYNIKGDTVRDVIRDAVMRIQIPEEIDRERIIASLLEREEMMTTGMGDGLALPHPRNPILSDISHESVSICFLDKPIDFNAIDDQPVHTLFIIFSANPRRHLEILSKISFFCSRPDFIQMLVRRESTDEIMRVIEFQEHLWRKKD